MVSREGANETFAESVSHERAWWPNSRALEHTSVAEHIVYDLLRDALSIVTVGRDERLELTLREVACGLVYYGRDSSAWRAHVARLREWRKRLDEGL